MRSLLRCSIAAAATLLLTFSAHALDGVRDQVSPIPGAGQSANFAVSNPAQVWQQQVRAGVTGTLVGVGLRVTGPLGARLHVRIRPSAGWTSSAPVFQTSIVKSIAAAQDVEIDTRAAGFLVAPGQRFVIELQGDGSQAGVDGSFTPTSQGLAQYTEPLFLSGPGCYASCGWRVGFTTHVQNGDVTEYCAGQGCPCGNDSSAGGCANSTGAGARLAYSSGSTSVALDDLTLLATRLPPNVATVVFMGSVQSRVAFGDGLRCAAGSVKRFAIQPSVAGSLVFAHPRSQSGSWIQPGAAWHFQAWYRDPAGPCHRSSNLSSALQVVFRP